jgi:hypothetical protein
MVTSAGKDWASRSVREVQHLVNRNSTLAMYSTIYMNLQGRIYNGQDSYYSNTLVFSQSIRLASNDCCS